MRHAATLISLVFVAALLVNVTSFAADTQNVSAGGYTITGPFTHDNLTLFLVLTKDGPHNSSYLTLQEGSSRRLSLSTRPATLIS